MIFMSLERRILRSMAAKAADGEVPAMRGPAKLLVKEKQGKVCTISVALAPAGPRPPSPLPFIYANKLRSSWSPSERLCL